MSLAYPTCFKGSCKEGTPKTQRVLRDRIELETVVTAIAVMSCMSCDVSFASDGRLPPPKTSRPARGSVTELEEREILMAFCTLLFFVALCGLPGASPFSREHIWDYLSPILFVQALRIYLVFKCRSFWIFFEGYADHLSVILHSLPRKLIKTYHIIRL